VAPAVGVVVEVFHIAAAPPVILVWAVVVGAGSLLVGTVAVRALMLVGALLVGALVVPLGAFFEAAAPPVTVTAIVLAVLVRALMVSRVPVAPAGVAVAA